MNQIQSILLAGVLYTTPVQQTQTYYISNLSETDGAKCGEYISITPMNPVQIPVQPIMPSVMEEHEGNSEE